SGEAELRRRVSSESGGWIDVVDSRRDPGDGPGPLRAGPGARGPAGTPPADLSAGEEAHLDLVLRGLRLWDSERFHAAAGGRRRLARRSPHLGPQGGARPGRGIRRPAIRPIFLDITSGARYKRAVPAPF